MTQALSWTMKDGALLLSGRIDENADLEQVLPLIPDGGMTLDLSGLTRINSIGVREWMDFLTKLGTRRLRLERCPPDFVQQLNAIANFAGSAEVASVLSEYECDRHGDTELVKVRTEDARSGTLPAPPRCKTCGAEMIPAEENESYFRFLRYTR